MLRARSGGNRIVPFETTAPNKSGKPLLRSTLIGSFMVHGASFTPRALYFALAPLDRPLKLYAPPPGARVGAQRQRQCGVPAVRPGPAGAAPHHPRTSVLASSDVTHESVDHEPTGHRESGPETPATGKKGHTKSMRHREKMPMKARRMVPAPGFLPSPRVCPNARTRSKYCSSPAALERPCSVTTLCE